MNDSEDAADIRWRRIVRWGLLVFLAIAGFVGWWIHQARGRHQHCIKASSMTLFEFAEGHGGKFPYSEKGWADALLQLASGPGDTRWIPFFVGVDDDGAVYREALGSGADIDERMGTRIYVQGLTKSSDPGIAILFDRHSVKGGDHLRGMPGQPMLREVITLDSAHQMIPDSKWAAFKARQKSLLREEGFSEAFVEGVYPD